MVQPSYPIIHEGVSASVPTTPGVYALENTITGAVYISCGSNLRARYRSWHSSRLMSAARLRRLCSPPLAAELSSAPAEGWRFVVLVTSEGMPEAERLRLEAHAIERTIKERGERCLNAETGHGPGRKMRYDGRPS